ncbi:MAG: hypothetical protein ACTSRZ_08460 [Promethearchaeota archaeon]
MNIEYILIWREVKDALNWSLRGFNEELIKSIYNLRSYGIEVA